MYLDLVQADDSKAKKFKKAMPTRALIFFACHIDLTRCCKRAIDLIVVVTYNVNNQPLQNLAPILKENTMSPENATTFMLLYEVMVESQMSEEQATVKHLEPLYNQLVAASGKEKLTYKDCQRALDGNGLYKTDEQLMLILKELSSAVTMMNGNNSKVKQEDNIVTHSNISDDDDKKNNEEDGEGLTFPEFVHCYKIVVAGMLTLQRLDPGTPERELTKHRCMQMLHAFLPAGFGGGGYNSSNSNKELNMDEVKRILTVKDWQLVRLIDEHAHEIDELADLIIRGKRAYRWTSVLRVGVLLGFFILGGGLYAKENGLLFSASSNASVNATGADTTIVGGDTVFDVAAVVNVCEDVGPYKQQLNALKDSNKKNLESISAHRKSESEFNRKVSQLERTNESAQMNISELKDIIVSSKAQISELEKAKKDALVALKKSERTEAKLHEFEREKQLTAVAMRESGAAAIFCEERLKDLQLEVKSLRTQSETGAEALKLCISKLDERHRGDRAMLPPPSISDQPAALKMENKERHPIRRFIVSAIVGALIASIVPAVVSMAFGSGAATTAVVATKATKAAKATKVAASAKGAAGGPIITGIVAALIAFGTGAVTSAASGKLR